MTTIKDKGEVLALLSSESEEGAQRALYKASDCGAFIVFHDWGIELGSIVEGCDFGTAVYPLRYEDGFTSEDVDKRIAAIEAEADALWKWANEGPEGSEETWENLGLDAPDVDVEYRHLGPSGRSC